MVTTEAKPMLVAVSEPGIPVVGTDMFPGSASCNRAASSVVLPMIENVEPVRLKPAGWLRLTATDRARCNIALRSEAFERRRYCSMLVNMLGSAMAVTTITTASTSNNSSSEKPRILFPRDTFMAHPDGQTETLGPVPEWNSAEW